jgi:hypothetical protein
MNGRISKLLWTAALSATAMFANNVVTVSLGSDAFPTGAIGPYLATVSGVKEFVFCDDETHTVYPNETWTATVTTLQDLIALGSANIVNSPVMFRSLPNALLLYQEAAWLVNQFGSNPNVASGIQNALWDVFLQKAGSGSPADPSTDAYWLAQAATNYSKLTAGQIANTVFLSPVPGSQNPLSNGTPQEFITLTPEPGSYVLMGAGLVLLSLATFRKKRVS